MHFPTWARSQDLEKERRDRRKGKGKKSAMAHTYPGPSLSTRRSRIQRDRGKPSGPALNPEGPYLNHSHFQDQLTQGAEEI